MNYFQPRIFRSLFQLFFGAGLLVSAPAFAQSSSNESVFAKNRQFDNEGIELYSSNLDMKKHKHFGFGLSLGGAEGVLGLNGEWNVEPQNAVTLGLGTGPSYGSFNAGWKYNFEGYYLSPYSRLGYSKWFSSGSSAGSARDSDILKRVMSEKDLKANRVDVDFVTASMGVEYNQLEGDLSGTNFFGELVLMADTRTATVIPAGSVGMTYFY